MPMNITAAMDRIIACLDEGKLGLANAIARGLKGEDQANALALIEGSSPAAAPQAAAPRTPPPLPAAPQPFRSGASVVEELDDALELALRSSVHGNVHPMDISDFIVENFEQLLGDEATYGEVTATFAPYLSKPFAKFADRSHDEARKASIGSSLAFLVRQGKLERLSKKTFRLPVEPVTFDASLPKGIYTVEFEDGQHRTYRVRRLPSNAKVDAGRMVLELLTGPHNESDYNRIGLADPLTLDRPNARHEEACRVLSDAANAEEAGMLFAMRESSCRRCGRTLTVPASKCQGLGPVCAKKVWSAPTTGDTMSDNRRFIIQPLDEPLRVEDGRILSDGVVGRIGPNNAFLRTYAAYTGATHDDLKLGEGCRAEFSLSGQTGVYTVVPAGRDPAEFFPVRLAEIPEMTWHGPHPARLPPGGETWAEDERGLFEVHRVQ